MKDDTKFGDRKDEEMSVGEFFKKAHSICEKHIGKCTECPLDEYCSDGIFNNTEIDILQLVEIVNTEANQSEEPPKVGKWIPCSEKLPEKSGEYLVTIDDGSVVITQFADDVGFLIGYPSELEVVAWEPLPEPYHVQP